jgi:hypothetical protein
MADSAQSKCKAGLIGPLSFSAARDRYSVLMFNRFTSASCLAISSAT